MQTITEGLRRWRPGGSRVADTHHRDRRCFDSIGVLISTRGSAPYVDLQLSGLHSMHGMSADVLVHNDGADTNADLLDVTSKWSKDLNVDFSYSSDRLGHYNGDMAAFLSGLLWARDNGLSHLVKFSRRWVPVKPWLVDLLDLIDISSAPTFSGYSSVNGLQFRTECMAVNVRDWADKDILDAIRGAVNDGSMNIGSVTVEPFLHGLARRIWSAEWATIRDDLGVPVENPSVNGITRDLGYVHWKSMMGADRGIQNAAALTHWVCSPQQYADLAVQRRLPYGCHDFELT